VIFVCVCVATASADSFGSYGSFSAALEEEAPAIEPFSGECRDKFMTGELELPYEGFGTCELTAGFGLCDFELAEVMAAGCALSCGACTAPAQPAASTCDYIVHIKTGGYADEMHWGITEASGGTTCSFDGGDCYSPSNKYESGQDYDEEVQLSPGNHIFVAYDVYGDGWNGGSYSVYRKDTGAVAVALTEFTEGFEEQQDFLSTPCGSASHLPSDSGGVHTDAPLSGKAPKDAFGPKSVEITVRTESWANEISWNIDGSKDMVGGKTALTAAYDNHKEYSKIYSLSPGLHTVNFYDEYGDGWNDGAHLKVTSNGQTILPETLFTNGVTMQASFDVGNTDPTDVTLPACLNDCAGEPNPADGPLNEARVCKFIGGLNLDLSDDDASCLSDCTAADDIQGLYDNCHELEVVFEDLPTEGPNALNAYSSFMLNGDTQEVTQFIDAIQGGAHYGSFNSFGGDNFNAQIQGGDSFGAGADTSTNAWDLDDAVTAAVEEPEQFDDDWFNSGGSFGLLMSAKEQQHSVATKAGVVKSSYMILVAGAACIAIALMIVSRRSASGISHLQTPMAGGVDAARPVPEGAADLI
jgi:hypothetical protein